MLEDDDWESISSMFNEFDKSPGNYMKLVVYKWGKAMEDILHDLDITSVQLELLAALAYLMRDGKSVTQMDVAKYSRKDKNTVSGVMRTLEKNGYVTRSSSEDDLRAKYLVITNKGLRMVKTALGEVLLIDKRFFPDEKESKDLIRLLKRYI